MLAPALAVLALAAPAGLAFSSSEDGIVSVDATGAGGRVLVGHAAEPAWSADGRTLAFVRAFGNDTTGGSRVFLRTPDGREKAITARARGTEVTGPRFSPDGDMIVFTRSSYERDAIRSAIVVRVLATGAERVVARELVHESPFDLVTAGAFSPDGARILYTRVALDRRSYFRPSLFLVGRDGRGRRLLRRDAGTGTFSPDGRRIAFSSTRERNGTRCGSDQCSYAGELEVMDADGRHVVRLTRNAGDDSYPDWSPDGTRIAFASDRNYPEGEHSEVYSITPEGRCLTWLTNGTGESTTPVWRPGTGQSTSAGGCGARGLRPRIAPVARPRGLPRGVVAFWLGPEWRGLLAQLGGEGRDRYVDYSDCGRYDARACAASTIVSFSSVCGYGYRTNATYARRLFARRGALVADRGPDEVWSVFSGRTEVALQGDAREAVAALRPLGRPRARLAPPAVPRDLLAEIRRIEQARRRLGSERAVARRLHLHRGRVHERLRLGRALAPFGHVRTVRCG